MDLLQCVHANCDHRDVHQRGLAATSTSCNSLALLLHYPNYNQCGRPNRTVHGCVLTVYVVLSKCTHLKLLLLLQRYWQLHYCCYYYCYLLLLLQCVLAVAL
jgi:hypothetical protein